MSTGAGVLLWHGKEIPAIIPGLSFNPNGHIFKFNTRPLKSVTQYTSKLQDHSFCNQVDMDWGSIVHDYLYKLDKGILDFDSKNFDHRFDGYIAGWIKFKKDRGFDTGKMLAEYPLVSEKYLFAGWLDKLFDIGNYDILLDIKTGQPTKVTGIQLAGYGGMAIERGLTTKSRLKLLEVCIDKDGRVRSQMFDFKKNWQYFLMAYSLQNHLNK